MKLKFHDFTQTTVEQSGAGRDLESYRQLLGQAFARGNRPVRLIGVGVRLLDPGRPRTTQVVLMLLMASTKSRGSAATALPLPARR